MKQFIGNPCMRGHTLRYVSNRACVECQKRRRAQRLKARRAQRLAVKTAAQAIDHTKRLTRVQARKQHLPLYYIRPCHKGHTTGRYVSNGQCVMCVSSYDARRNKSKLDEFGLPIKSIPRKKNSI